LASQLHNRRVDLLYELGYSCCCLILALSNVHYLHELLPDCFDRLSDAYFRRKLPVEERGIMESRNVEVAKILKTWWEGPCSKEPCVDGELEEGYDDAEFWFLLWLGWSWDFKFWSLRWLKTNPDFISGFFCS
jgi:hypothetical protein